MLVHLIILLVIYSVANYQTLGFYFWHDDFSSFYGPLVNQCIHGWPYYGFCTIFDWLVKTIGYTPLPYFLIGNTLGFLSVVLFYLLANNLFKNKITALGVSGLLASSYIGSGIFLEAWDPLISFLTLTLLFASLTIFLKANHKGFSSRLFFLSIMILLISLSLFHFRASTNFIPFIALFILFSHKVISFKKRLVLSIFLLTLSLFTFFILPLKILKQPMGSFHLKINVPAIATNPSKITYLFQTISSFIYPDYLHSLIPQTKLKMVQTLIGIVSSSFFVIYSLRNWKKDRNLTRIRIFSGIWILGMFLPYWIRNDFYLNSTHRYILWMLPGILLAWGTFFKNRFWLIITLLIIILNLFQIHKFYSKHLLQSRQQQSFYAQLHKLLPTLEPESILYFNYPSNIKDVFDDFFRVGFTPPESALGTEYQVDYKTIKLITDSEVLSHYLQQNSITTHPFYSFFWDGQTLLDTTSQTKSLIGKTFSNQKLESQIDGFPFLLPGLLRITATATFLSVSLPHKQECVGCELNIPDRSFYFKYLVSNQEIKSNANLKAENASENTDSQNLLDDYEKNYWLFNRQLWHQDTKPEININLTNPYNLEGFILFGSYPRGRPSEMEVVINDKEVPIQTQAFSQGVKVFFEKQKVEKLTIKILKTIGGDTPLVNEIDFIPNAFKTVDPLVAMQVRKFPVNEITSFSQIADLKDYLKGGSPVCLKWSNENNNGEKSFPLIVDGKPHSYQIPIPALGPAPTTFSISCLNFPVHLEITSIEAAF